MRIRAARRGRTPLRDPTDDLRPTRGAWSTERQLRRSTMTQQFCEVDAVIAGHYDRRFTDLVAALAEELTTGGELGAAITVDIDGTTVVDIWGGYADRSQSRQWDQDTIVNVFSSTKNITALAALLLIDRGSLDPFAPVARYWPEFAANGKQDIEVRHILSHTSGVSGWEMPFSIEDVYDWENSTARLAAQAPW